MALLRKADQAAQWLLRRVGYFRDEDIDQDEEFIRIYLKCRDYSLTSKERMYALYKAVRYVVEAGVPGDLVECGLWRGGSSMMIAHTLILSGQTGRKIYMYDTYGGMPEPSGRDVDINDVGARRKWERKGGSWAYASLDEVKANMISTGYPKEMLVFVKGKVEDTIPSKMPEAVALLRLDTDFYESTYHELKHLYPALSRRGVLILDDYGHWKGAREAVDRYFKENKVGILLGRVDYTGRVGVKD